MRIYLSLILLIAGLSDLKPQSSWQWQNPKPQGNNLNSVTIINNKTGYAVGDAGTIMKTTNAGVSVSLQVSGTYRTLNYVDFTDQENTGYAAGDNGTILKTTNGGMTWMNLSFNNVESYKCINFPADEQTGFITGINSSLSQGLIYKTTNGGDNWLRLFPGINGYFFAVQFPKNADTGYVIMTGYSSDSSLVLKTADGGLNWSGQNQPVTGILRSLSFPENSQVGYITGYTGEIYKTTNGGINWILQIRNPNANFTSIDFPENEEFGTAAGLNGYYMRTTDGGKNWFGYTVPDPDNNDLYSVSFSDSYTGFASGTAGSILVTTDSGISWRSIRNVPVKQIESSCFPQNSLTGYVCGSGLIMKTTDGGEEWLPQSAEGDTVLFRDIFFPFNSETGFVCGSMSRIYKTTDGGQNWIRQFVNGIESELTDIDFPVNINTGYITGDRIILKTTNSGDNWEQLNSPSAYFNAVSFPSDNETGYVSGESGATGRIYKTTDGGLNWIQQTTGLLSGIVDISFPVNDQNGFAVEWAGKILKTTNGGMNWMEYYAGINVYGICFPVNSITGYATGERYSASYLLKTTDGGNSWNRLNIPYNKTTSSVCFPGSTDTGYVTGLNGAILKTADGGGFTSVNSVSEFINGNYYLYQNYPNPFNPVTKVEFDISESGFVSLKVYDMLGKEAAILVNEHLSPGKYTVKFDGSNHSAGVYFYRMESGGFVSVKKLVLLK